MIHLSYWGSIMRTKFSTVAAVFVPLGFVEGAHSGEYRDSKCNFLEGYSSNSQI